MSDYRLTWDLLASIHVAARDRVNDMVLLGGLGVMHVGQMWVPNRPSMQGYPGYDEAPDLTSQPSDNHWG